MKLLLTSTGITNESIKKKFLEMVGKKPEEIRLAYIPTAVFSIATVPHKDWMIDNLRRLDDLKIGIIDIFDFSSLPKDNWLPRLESADVIFVEGGAVIYLSNKVKEAGLDKLLPELLKDKVYVGCSGGSTLLGKTIIASSPNEPGYKGIEGLNLYDFSIRPHFYRADRAQFNEEMIQKLANEFNSDFYAIDDNSAVAVKNGKVEVISEGKWEKFEK